jgi:subtilisin family serine protease
VVVAAVGNADEERRRPWPFASYPAALPHVLGVSAVSRDGAVPPFSARDRIYNDLAAPGQGILSTFPRALSRPGCANVGYSDCAADSIAVDRRAFRRGEGTSFAAPQVAAAAALVLAVRPGLSPDQVATILTRTAEDMTPATGCAGCSRFRDRLTGWGRIDVTAAVQRAAGGRLPPTDRRETNDDAGSRAATLWGRGSASVNATVDFWDDQNDVYRIRLRPGRRASARLVRAPSGVRLFLWRPGTTRVEAVARVARDRVAASRTRARRQLLTYRVPRRAGGWYYLQVRIENPGSGAYALRVKKG